MFWFNHHSLKWTLIPLFFIFIFIGLIFFIFDKFIGSLILAGVFLFCLFLRIAVFFMDRTERKIYTEAELSGHMANSFKEFR